MVQNMYIIENNLDLVINSDGPKYRRLGTNTFVSFVFSTFDFVSCDFLIFCNNVNFLLFEKGECKCGVVSDTVKQETKWNVSGDIFERNISYFSLKGWTRKQYKPVCLRQPKSVDVLLLSWCVGVYSAHATGNLFLCWLGGSSQIVMTWAQRTQWERGKMRSFVALTSTYHLSQLFRSMNESMRPCT